MMKGMNTQEAIAMERKDVSGSKSLSLTEISKGYSDDFIEEIRQILGEIELALVNLEMEPTNKAFLNNVYRSFHTIHGLTGLLDEQVSGQITSASEDLLETLRKYTNGLDSAAVNILLQSVRFIRNICMDSSVLYDSRFSGEIAQHLSNIHQIRDDILLEARQPLERETRIGEILIREGALDKAEVDELLKKQSARPDKMKFGEMVLREKKVDATEIIKAIRMQKIRGTTAPDQYVRIPLERLDQIITLINNVNSTYDGIRDEAVLRFGSNDIFTLGSGKATQMMREIKRVLLELRMVTLHSTFQKLTRTVCSLIEEKHLQIMFSTMGESIEVDKEAADRIVQPLAEIARMMIDHAVRKENDEELKLHSIEVVAYDEGQDIRIDVVGDCKIDILHIKQDKVYSDLVQRIGYMQGRLVFDDMAGEGMRAKITFPR
jgi:two-component system chemotaxis sensor kinase CheA